MSERRAETLGLGTAFAAASVPWSTLSPAAYPVATVTKIVNDPNEAFLEIYARPVALLNHSKQVLLIWPGAKSTEPQKSADVKKAAEVRKK